MPKLKLSPSAQREKNISDTLRCAMIRKGWSNQHFAELLGMDPGHLSKIINHPMSVRFETICIIASKLGLKELPTV